MSLIRFCLALVLLAAPAQADVPADVPRVATDITPVHSLVAMVMQGLGTPDLIVSPGASPHRFALRPSEARALQEADLVVWIGPELTPWLEQPIKTLAPKAEHLELLEVPGTHLLTFRKSGGKHKAGHDHGGHDHGSHGHGGHDHHHSGTDPHAWLDPENGAVWLAYIADTLARLDPANAAQYRANALAGQAELAALQADLSEMLVPMQGRPFVTFHDAYQYFEARFGLTSAGSVKLGDAADPGPARLARLRDEMIAVGVTCAFSEPQFDPGLLHAVAGQGDIQIIPLDPLGSQLDVGPELYLGLFRDMGRAFASCTDPG